MLLQRSINLGADPAAARRRAAALTAAIALRNCSLRHQATPADRCACRTLMREAARTWRHDEAPGRWER